jgi:hypothetical protein
MKKLILSFLLLATYQVTFAQNIYKVKLNECNTQQFGLESRETTAKIKDKDVLELLIKSMKEDAFNKIRVVLKLQVIVYKDGTSCLLSFENETNLSSEELNIINIKYAIDSQLKWTIGDEAVAALMEIDFKKRKTVINRFGIHGDLGWHQLKN